MWDEFVNVCLPADLTENDLKYYKMLFMSGCQAVVLVLAHKSLSDEHADEVFAAIRRELEGYFMTDLADIVRTAKTSEDEEH